MLDSIDLCSSLEMEGNKDARRARVQSLRRLGRQVGATVVSSDDAGCKKVTEMVEAIRKTSGCDRPSHNPKACGQRWTDHMSVHHRRHPTHKNPL